jgi:hypothetical protein
MARDYEKRLEAGGNMGAVADSMKLPYKEFGPFSRINPPLTDPVVVGTAFGLDVGQRSRLLDTKDGIYFVKALEHTKADSAAFAKDLENYRPQMIRAAQQDRVRSYLEALRQSAKVVDDRKKVLQQTAPVTQGA